MAIGYSKANWPLVDSRWLLNDLDLDPKNIMYFAPVRSSSDQLVATGHFWGRLTSGWPLIRSHRKYALGTHTLPPFQVYLLHTLKDDETHSRTLHTYGQQWRSHWGWQRGGRVPPLTAKNLPKIGKKRGKSRKIGEKTGKIGKKRGKSGRKGKSWEVAFTLPLLTDRAGYATDRQTDGQTDRQTAILVV